MTESRVALLHRVIAYAAREGIADRSLREIAGGVGTSHRMLLYHFGSREGLLAAIVGAIEAQQREAMVALARSASPPEVMRALWKRVSSRRLRPFARLFFEVVALGSRGAPEVRELMGGLTGAWLDEGTAMAEQLDLPVDRTALRLGVAVSRGLLLDLLAGAPAAEVDAAHELFVDLMSARGGGTAS